MAQRGSGTSGHLCDCRRRLSPWGWSVTSPQGEDYIVATKHKWSCVGWKLHSPARLQRSEDDGGYILPHRRSLTSLGWPPTTPTSGNSAMSYGHSCGCMTVQSPRPLSTANGCTLRPHHKQELHGSSPPPYGSGRTTPRPTFTTLTDSQRPLNYAALTHWHPTPLPLMCRSSAMHDGTSPCTPR